MGDFRLRFSRRLESCLRVLSVLVEEVGILRLVRSAVVVLVINLYVGVGVFAFVGLAGAVFTYFVLRPKWNLLDDF